jgi:hypothetical protein
MLASSMIGGAWRKPATLLRRTFQHFGLVWGTTWVSTNQSTGLLATTVFTASLPISMLLTEHETA